MNKTDFDGLLEGCRVQLEGGKSLKEILAENPAQAERLEPLLQSILLAGSLPKPVASETAVLQGKNRLLTEVDNLRNENHFLKNGTKDKPLRYSGQWFKNIGNILLGQENTDMKLIPRLAIYLVITVLVAGFFTINASASSLPGDVFYGLKLNLEQVKLALAFNNDAKQELEQEFENERLSEVDSLLNEGREEDVEFTGVIEDMGVNFFIVSGVAVMVGPETEIIGPLEIGDLVRVEAFTQEDGSLFALEIYLDVDDVVDGDVDDLDDSDDDLDDDSDDDLDDDSDDDLDDDSDDDLDDDSNDDLDDDSDDDLDDDSDDDLDDDSDDEEVDEEDDDEEDDDEDDDEEDDDKGDD